MTNGVQGDRLLQPISAQQQHPVQTGERPDFERTTSSGVPARPGPITSGMPKPRLDFRVSSGFLDAGALTNDSQVRPWPGRASAMACMHTSAQDQLWPVSCSYREIDWGNTGKPPLLMVQAWQPLLHSLV